MVGIKEPGTEMQKRSGNPGPLAGLLLAIGLAGAAFWVGQHYPAKTDTAAPPTPSVVLPMPGSGKPLTVAPGMPIGENTIADIASEASKSVVTIDTSSSVVLPDSPFGFNRSLRDFEFFFGPGFRFGPSEGQRKFESKGSGSGVIIRPDGYILTNNHVIGNADKIKVALSDNRVFDGRVVGKDSFSDVALVKIDARDLPVARFGTSKTLRPGDWAIAIGNPLGLEHTVTLGIISALGRSLSALQNNVELIQTDAAINPGNSGGPLLNIHGEVIGVNTAIRGDAQNIGFALPIDVARDVAQQLLQGGKIARAYVGIYMQDLDEKLAKALGLSDSAQGVVVVRVAPDSPAEKAGLRQGDVIEKVDGKAVTTSKEVQQLVRSHKPGQSLNLLLYRNGQLTSQPLEIGDYPAEALESSR
jgi:serine protease Do